MSTLRLEEVTKSFRGPSGINVRVLDEVTLTVKEGTISGLVGESGSGKTTLIRCVMGLEKIESGKIIYGSKVLQPTRRGPRDRMHPKMQLVFQNPTASLNPRMTVGSLVGEGLVIHRIGNSKVVRRNRVAELLVKVGLDPRDAGRYPRSFSGGQRQRIAIARALAVEPEILICDEPVSALDVSVQAQVLNLLRAMQRDLGLTILLVAHDLAVVKQLCADVAVMEKGRIVEVGPTEAVLGNPQHPYTRSLIDAVPVPDPVIARRKAVERCTQRNDAASQLTGIGEPIVREIEREALSLGDQTMRADLL